MPDNYTPGGSNKQFSAAIKIQAAFRAFQSRCNRHNDKFLVRKFPITMPLIFNPEENLEENEMYNAFVLCDAERPKTRAHVVELLTFSCN